jgi:preprotein translocase SecE subunit
VARDRQRAKQRQRRRNPSGGGPAAGSRSTRARDIGLDDATVEDSGLDTGSTQPPEPTKHALPDVEQARLEESEPEPEDGEFEVGETDPAVAEERAEARRPKRRRNRVVTFLGHVVDELRRVQWPNRRQTGQGTAVVLGFVVIAGGYLGLMDAIWKPIIEAIL